MNQENFRILLVDDEPDILEFIGYNLTREGYSVFKAENGLQALKMARQVLPHLIILDVMMPEMDGMETCVELRKFPELSHTVIAFLTARGEDYSQLAGFDAGADDYITKPIKPSLLIGRVKALLRRSKQTTPETDSLQAGTIRIDRERYLVIKDQQEITLPKKEFELLTLLVSRPNKVFSREEIFASVWGTDVVVGDRTIDVHVRKLREKIGIENIKTVKGVGYKFEV
ncbi:MAG: response regulator transcription factor [Bacteroides sp.]|jgi:two-component system alkaline phosphatase synthesis response regulator PhoP|nr:response regulator transcription factor [Bacteroides sp.]